MSCAPGRAPMSRRPGRRRRRRVRPAPARWRWPPGFCRGSSSECIHAGSHYLVLIFDPAGIELTAITQLPCRSRLAEYEGIDGMASATVEETTPEARVLVVDDETNIVELLSVSLKFQGFEVHAASNGP